jgi:hypothetical protein
MPTSQVYIKKYLVENFQTSLLGIKLIEVMRMRLKHTKESNSSMKVADQSPSFSPLG